MQITNISKIAFIDTCHFQELHMSLCHCLIMQNLEIKLLLKLKDSHLFYHIIEHF